jgi:hypothetical protein
MTEQRPLSRYTGPTTLVDLLDRVIDGGAMISGDVLIALGGIDLIRLDLRLLLVSAARSHEPRARCP